MEGVEVLERVSFPGKGGNLALILCMQSLLEVIPLVGIIQIAHGHSTAHVDELRRMPCYAQFFDEVGCLV